MMFVKLNGSGGKVQYVNPDMILRVTARDLETEVLLANGYSLSIKGQPHEVVKQIVKQVEEQSNAK